MPRRMRPRTRSSATTIEARNGLDSMVYNVEKMLKDAGDKVAGSDKSEVEIGAGRCEEDSGGNTERE